MIEGYITVKELVEKWEYHVTKKAGGGVRKTYFIPGTGLSWSEDSENIKRVGLNHDKGIF